MTFQTGDIVEGKVTGIQPYGAFVALDDHTSGLIHISEISEGYVRDIARYVTVGETVRVKIIDFDPEVNQARLSLKALRTPRPGSLRGRYQRPSLPDGKIGFASITASMESWIQEAERDMEGEKTNEPNDLER